ncbi:MAG: 3D domain-containing protein [Caulobacteraceae bacterium]
MNRRAAWSAALLILAPFGAQAAQVKTAFSDPIGDLIGKVESTLKPILATFGLKATLYHTGGGVGTRDASGCKVVPMRTVAVDPRQIPEHTVLFIKQTVGMPLPGGGKHDGYWYATDKGSAIHKGRIDLFTGWGARSMTPLMDLNLSTLTVTEIGRFTGCPPTRD